MTALNLILLALVALVVGVIVRAIRQTNALVEHRLRGTDKRMRKSLMADMAAQIREQANRMRCPRCDGPVFAMLDRDPWYKCDVCNTEFEGPPHLPVPEGAAESGHPTG